MNLSKVVKFVIALGCVVVLGLTSSSAFAQRAPNGFGIGIGAGTIAGGLSIKTGSGGFHFQGVIGPWRGHGPKWRYGADSIGVSGDFLYEQPALASGSVLSLGWNYGIGAGVGVGDWRGAIIGVTGVVGLEFNFVPAPIDVVIEYRPGIYIGNDALALEFVDFTPHVRFWF